MKKTFTLLVVVVLCFCFVGCTSVDDSPIKETGEEENNSSPQEQENELCYA